MLPSRIVFTFFQGYNRPSNKSILEISDSVSSIYDVCR